MSQIDETVVKSLFEQVNETLAGHPMDVSVAALQDLIVASICWATPTKSEAKALCAEIHEDLQKTIDKNFDHYHSQQNASNTAKRRSH